MVRRVAPLLALALVLHPAGAPARAQEARPRVTRTLDVDAEAQDVRALLADVARRAGVTIVVDARVQATVTVRLHQVSWRDAVSLIAARARCTVSDLAGGGVLVTCPRRISVQLHEADVRVALLLLAGYGGKGIVIGPAVRGKVTLELRDVEWAAALRAVASDVPGDALTVLGLDEEVVTVGAGGGAPEAPSSAILAGALVRRDGDVARVRLEDGSEVDLTVDARARATFEALRPGDRLVVTYEARDGRLVVTNCVTGAR